MQEVTADKAALFKALDAMYVEGGQTAIIDAVYLSANNLLNKGKPAGDKPRRHALVLISDGEDRASYYKIDDLFKLLRKSDIQIFCIGLTASLDKERGFTTQSKREKATDLLKRLASATGGRVYFAEKGKELALLGGEKDIAQAAEGRLILYRKQRAYHQQDPEGHKIPRQ